ncbi:Crp/Fnr family transcriptional regulator [Pseudaestuariivita rosea]|uniref:Crp/Fnr family transcriptional regulator n=1 Tax=Pseudaestuariivita rosea TaxID=2763263 RepID=UPI001ABAFDE2|nr:Crp/Fnr family transcriptional regulator [Pseudaestuariivita rosea]
MTTSCRNCPLRRRALFDPIESDELDFMQRFKSGELSVDADTLLMMEGSNSPQLFTVLSGMGLRYKTLPNGRRQVVNFVFPGDFLGLQAGVMNEMKHSVEATTSMTLCVFNRSELWNLFKNHPGRAYDLVWLASLEEHFLGDALTAVGQRDALERISWSFHRIYIRMTELGLVTGQGCQLPYRQQDLADALGLSLVHTNKTLKKLRDMQVASWNEGRLTVSDLDRLAELAMVDDHHVETRPLI